MPELPRLRSFQRLQMKASLTWAARRLGLEPPAWLEFVAV
jgi:DNA-binding transcriptional LysR family regulator